jgi:hypothetical protein
MPTVKVEPTKDFPVPYDLSEEKTNNLLEEMAVAGNTVELQHALGVPLDFSEEDAAREKELLQAVAKAKKPSNLKQPNTAFAAAAFLRTYGQQLAMDASAARSAITNKLMELANCGDPRFELKALELLGKHSDIGIFTQRSEISIKYDDPARLEKEIKERIKRLLNASVVDTMPFGDTLDEELGLGEYKDADEEIEDIEDVEDAELVEEETADV